ncbi:hypothetical protein JCM5353_005449 [Sporobolomyces roseus]
MACTSCSRLARIRAGPSTLLSIPRRNFSINSPLLASPAPDIDLTFPSKHNPDPFEIFHFDRKDPLNHKAIKSRYLDLVRKYHPDRIQHSAPSKGKAKGKGTAKEESVEFKQIVAAYEILKDDKKRNAYLKFGMGWGRGGNGGGGGGGRGSASPWSQSTTEYHFRRGRPMNWTASGDRWSGTWDYTWTDPHNPHFRPEQAGGVGTNTSSAGWEGRGTIGKNGIIFLGLASITLFISPLTAWYSFPSVVSPEEMAAGSEGNGTAWIPRMYDKRHLDAATNLHIARSEAKQSGQAKLEAFKRKAKQLERERAFERAREIQAIERSGGTGHLALPPPSSS